MRAGAVVDYKGASDSRSLEFLKSLGRRGAAAINLGLHSYEFTLEALNGDHVILCDAVLFTACLDDCVHN